MAINRDQFRVVFITEVILVSTIAFVAYGFWDSVCEGSLKSCVGTGSVRDLEYIFLSILRPFFFTPVMVTAMIAGSSFGPILGTFLAALGASISAMLIYLPGHILGRKIVRPWLSANLPATWQFLRTQDHKVVLITRWLPFFPFDIFSFMFGIANFHARRVFIYTFIGVLPECYMFAYLADQTTAIGETIFNLVVFAIVTAAPLLIYEFLFRRRGSDLWTQIKRTYFELVHEARVNNDISRRNEYDQNTVPVILLYGFGSSRRALAIMERLLKRQGHQVMSFNLGGALGVFFTKGIKETARFIDKKIQRQMGKYSFQKVSIVAHSKGGLVAMWWLLKMGGSKYCDKLITLGTPFKGSWITYIALATPLGFIWRDLWQMRPGSSFLKELHELELPKNTRVYCCYSIRDRVAKGSAGLFEPDDPISQTRIIPVPMHHVAHFEFLYRRDVGDSLVRMLKE